MDYSELDRKSLQALAKENGIRANLSNAKIVEALLAQTEKAAPISSVASPAVTAAEREASLFIATLAEVVCGVEDTHGRNADENLENRSSPKVSLENLDTTT